MVLLPTIAFMASLYIQHKYLVIIIIATTHNITNLIGYLSRMCEYEQEIDNMAFWSLYKWFSKFRKRPYINYINLYKQKMFNDWYESLTENGKEEYQIKKKIEKEKRKKRDAEMLLYFTNIMKLYQQI